jgi:NADPH:quinone reductase-like Zn-dependent oxidoreductase
VPFLTAFKTAFVALVAMVGSLSIRNEFGGGVVLLTGATGYVGGLVLESLLRTTAVHKVYVLLRSKGQQSPQERLANVLQVI